MHLALPARIGAAELVGHPRQRDAGHRLMHTRRRSCICTAERTAHVTAEPARPLATGDSTPPCEAMPCGVPGGACTRVGDARRRSTTSEPGRSEIGDQAPMHEPDAI